MKYLHRAMIGIFGAIGKEAGEESQKLANKIAYEMGKQIGYELIERGLISEESDAKDIVDTVLHELDVAKINVLTTPEHKIFEMTDCNICPRKVGKYPLRATACPLPGIIKGVLTTVEKGLLAPFPDLNPGEVCRIKINREEWK